MEKDQRSSNPRKYRYPPNPPKKPKPPKTDLPPGAEDEANDLHERKGPKADSKSAEDAVSQNTKKEYEEPWDYKNDYYPVTLPLRKPNSGDPDILNEVEFWNGAEYKEYDENAVNHASELGLVEENSEKGKMIFFQLPSKLPFTSVVKENAPDSASAKGKDGSSPRAQESKKKCSLEEFPKEGGSMGKMLVYKSGAVKWKLGSNLFDVSTGVDCKFAQNVVAINTDNKVCCELGEVVKRAVVTPDIDSLLLDTDTLPKNHRRHHHHDEQQFMKR